MRNRTGIKFPNFLFLIVVGLFAAFAYSLPPTSTLAQEKLPAVVVLASYHQGDNWTDKEIIGIQVTLADAHRYLIPAIEYLDTKRNPEPQYGEVLLRYLAGKYGGKPVDLIIVLDNPAFNLLLAHRQELFPGIPVVFAGMNSFHPNLIAGQEMITGVEENQDLAGTIQMAIRMHQNLKQVFAIHDYTESGLALRDEIEALKTQLPQTIEITYPADAPFETLKGELQALPADSVAMIMTYVTDGAGKTYSREESTRLITSASPVPVYAMHETRLGFGIVGGMLLEGTEHGSQAARIALRVLAGESPGSIPVERSNSKAVLDYAALTQFPIPRGSWPTNAVIMNQPASLWDTHRETIILILQISSILIFFLILLAIAITGIRQARATLAQREALLNATQRLSKVGGWEWDVERQSMFWTDETYRIHDLDPAEIPPGSQEHIAKSVECYIPEHRKKIEETFFLCIEKGQPYDLVSSFTTYKGRQLWIRTTAQAVWKKGKVSQVIGNIMDITDQKQAEESIKKALEEKETLLRELYHRTKNNMQVIQSMLALQALHTQSGIQQSVFKETENRIQAMALVHQKLYQAQDLSNLNFADYLQDLIHLLLQSYQISPDQIQLHLDMQPMIVSLDTAIPCGLIMNELITNAFKHAFPGNQFGEIWIGISKTDQGAVKLVVRDNGVGVPNGFDFRSQASYGLETIFAITEHQLQGTVTFEGNHGVTCHIQFMDSQNSPRV